MHVSSSLFSRLLLLTMGVVVVGLAYLFIATSFSAVGVPPVPPRTTPVSFDPKTDVSKDPIFKGLRPLADKNIEVGPTGRLNPFVAPSPVAIVVSTSTQVSTTSAQSVSSTQPIAPSSTPAVKP